ncbi:MAG: GNAT family N-acetyltransferase [Ramlibacter sp.]|nr:GNAT family N-acetyltransferase [Ramlibacter sp.]
MTETTATTAPAPQGTPTPDTAVHSKRLVLRLVRDEDLPQLLDMNADDIVTRYLPYESWRDMADAQAWMGRAQARLAAGEAWQFVIVLRESGRVIGSCLLFHFDRPNGRAELGYLLGREHWGAGYMQEAAAALVGYAFGPAGLRRLEAEIDPRNEASARLLERVGFVKEGHLRERWDTKGEVSDSGLYGLLRSDWMASRQERG